MEWLTTGEAAAMLGTSTTTIRAMAGRGDLVHRITDGRERRRWAISRDSAQSWLAAHGRVNDRRSYRRTAVTHDADFHQVLGTVVQELRHMEADRDRLSNEVAVLRAVALQLRARNEAISQAESYQAQASKLLLDAAQAQALAAEALRRGLSAQDDALGQFLVPGPPRGD